MASAALKKYGTNAARYGMGRHNYRTGKNHSNKDIDPSRSHLNRHYGPQTEEEYRARFESMVAECDAKHPPRRKKKDRKTYLAVSIPSPREGMTAEQEAAWSAKTWEVMQELFPGQVVGATYHADEIHKYIDPNDKQEHISRGHTHYGVIPWTDEYGLNMDKFYRRDLPNKINAALDKACMEMFGFPFRDGSQQKSRGTVEQMKLDSTIAEQEQVEQKVQYAKDELETVQMATEQERETLQAVQEENNTLMSQNEALRTNNIALEQRADAAEQRLARAEGAFSRFMARVSEWVDAHTGLQRILRTAWRLSDAHRDKIETRAEDTVKQGTKAVLAASESLESLLAAEDEMEQGTRVFKALKTAVKEDLDPDELLDGMEL